MSRPLLALIALCVTSSPALAVELVGTTFCGNGPMDGATVEAILDATQTSAGLSTTGADGRYALTLSVGVYDIVVTPPAGSGCSAETIQNKSVTADETFDIILFRQGPATVTVSGQVTFDGLPAPSGSELRFQTSGQSEWAYLDHEGRFSVELVPGTYQVRYWLYGNGVATPDSTSCTRNGLVVEAPTVLDLEIPLASVSGSVIGTPSGTPAQGLDVYAYTSAAVEGTSCNSNSHASTGPDGAFGPLVTLATGNGEVHVSAIPGAYRSATTSIQHMAAEPLTVQLAVEEVSTVRVSGVVTTHAGLPLPYGELRWRSSENDFWSYADGAGYFELDVVPATYTVTFWSWSDGWQGIPENVNCRYNSVLVEDALSFDIRVPVATLSGTAIGQPSGTPAADLGVYAYTNHQFPGGFCNGSSHRTTDEQGAFGPMPVIATDGERLLEVHSGLVSGRYSEASASTLAPEGSSVTVELNPEEIVTYRVSGQLGFLLDGVFSPPAQAYSQVEWDSSGQYFYSSIDPEGLYEVQMPTGTFRFRAYGEGYGTQQGAQPDTWNCTRHGMAISGETTFDFTIPLVRVNGRVTNSAGIPIEGVHVSAGSSIPMSPGNCNNNSNRVSDADGRYSIAISPGSAWFSFTPPSGSGYVPAEINTTLTGNLQQQVVLQLPDIVPPVITTGPLVIHHSDTSVSVQWSTNEVTDARLELSPGTTLSGTPTVLTRAQLRVDHIFTLKDLERVTTYAYRVISKDAAGNAATSPVFTFTTLADPDIDAPLILSGPLVTYLAPTIARVSWATNEPATSEVSFGLAGGPLDRSAGSTTSYVLNHDVVLSGLTPEATYTLVVASRDPDGNGPTTAAPLTVTTPAVPDTTPPVISNLRTECITHQAMAVCWDTDEAATGNVSFQNQSTGAVTSLTSQTLALSRCMSVSGLSPATSYSIAVSSADGGFNVAYSGPLERTTLASATAGAPVLSNLSATYLSETSALVTWQTDVAATTFVRFGEDPAALDRSAGDLTAATTEHRVVLTGLPVGAPTWVTAQSSNPCQQTSLSASTLVVDLDECGDDPTVACGANSTCQNTIGGFTCGCVDGYERLGDACADIDECGDDPTVACGANATCQNTVGGFTCGCVDGYERLGDVCADIDECATPLSACGANSTCQNTIGGFTCACVDGYERLGDACADIDECATPLSACGANSTCQNTIGGFTCGCVDGYERRDGVCVVSDPCYFGGPGCDFDTVILTGPPALTAEPVATFTFDVVDGELDTFECRLDGGPWLACAFTFTTPPLSDGAHTFLVRSLRRGVYDDTPAFWSWTVDTSRPTTSLLLAPPALSGSAIATFAWTANQPVTWRCALDPVDLPPAPSEWVACGPTYTTPALTDGPHRLVVRATNALGLDEVPDLLHTWTIDTTVPVTRIDAGPPATSCGPTAAFAFSSPSATAFVCRLDGAPFGACASPLALDELTEGLHIFEVAAVDALGRLDPEPARHPFVVDLTRPTSRLQLAPDALSQSDAALFVFDSDDPSATFECSLGELPFAACASPHHLDELADGDHRFALRALDNCGAGPSLEHTWRIDTRWPDTAFLATPPTPLGRDEAATFTFEDPSETATSFECSLDGADFAPCSSPLELPALAVGAHTLAVRACFDPADALPDAASAARCDPAPALFSWQVDASICPRDTSAPTLTCADAVTLECAAGLGSPDLAALSPTVEDPCTPTLSTLAPETFPLGVSPVVFVATDGNANLASCVTPVHVVDTAPPTLSCPADLTRSAAADRCGLALALTAPLAADACDASPLVTSDAPPFFPVGVTDVTFTARDASGHLASCQTRVTIVDDTPLALVCDPARTVTAPADACAWSGSLTATATDNCAPTTSVVERTNTYAVGARTVTFEATLGDETDTCDTALTVLDVTPPAVVCPTVTAIAGAFAIAPIAADACGAETTLSELTCRRVDGGADPTIPAESCPVSLVSGRIQVTAARLEVPIAVTVRVDATDPSGNVTTETCAFELPALAAPNPPTPGLDPDILAGGGAGCAAAEPSWPLSLTLALLVLFGLGPRRRSSTHR